MSHKNFKSSLSPLFVKINKKYKLCVSQLQFQGKTPILDPIKLHMVGIDNPSTIIERQDLVDWVAANGLITNPAFVDAVDLSLIRSPCICCSYALTTNNVRRADALISSILQYFLRSQYLESMGFYRAIERLTRDVTTDELKNLKEYANTLTDQPSIIFTLNTYKGLCCSAPLCHPHILWVYSTVEGRRLLRHITRRCQKLGSITRVYLATRHLLPVPRLSYRLYAIEIEKYQNTNYDVLWNAIKMVEKRMQSKKSVAV